VDWAAGRPFAWVSAHHQGPALLHSVDASNGLRDQDFSVLEAWLRDQTRDDPTRRIPLHPDAVRRLRGGRLSQHPRDFLPRDNRRRRPILGPGEILVQLLDPGGQSVASARAAASWRVSSSISDPIRSPLPRHTTVEERGTDHLDIRQTCRSKVPPNELHPFRNAAERSQLRERPTWTSFTRGGSTLASQAQSATSCQITILFLMLSDQSIKSEKVSGPS
jgi:hypothetical protein